MNSLAAVVAPAGSKVVLVVAEEVEFKVVGQVVCGRVDVMGGAFKNLAGRGRWKDFVDG